MPVSPGKPRMALWAGSASPTRHHRQGRTVSSLAEAASSADPPYWVSSRTTDDRSSPVTYIIAQPCVDVLDRACIEECPVDCIYEGERMLYIHPDECVDCGACEPVCPVEAIYYEDDVPDQWSGYTQINADFFSELGSPGGASKVGQTDNDPQAVKDLPPQGED